VKEALRALEAAHQVKHSDDGYRIPTPAEDDWERLRNGISPKPGDSHRLYQEALSAFWQPQPSHTLFDTKTFKAGLAIHGREIMAGDMVFQVHLAEDGKEFDALAADLRKRSQQERKHVFWAIALTDSIDRETVELFRSKEMLARKERETKGEDTPALIAEERVRLRRDSDELRRLLRAACLSGRVYFRGNDRSPTDRAVDVGKTAAEVLGTVLPEVFDRFREAAAKATDVKKGTDALFTAENLQGLPSVFGSIGLLRDEKGKTVFRTESGTLKEVLDRIDERANYGDTASGRYLTDEFAKEPFGWDFEVVRLLVLSLLRSGKIEATSKGQTIDSVTGAGQCHRRRSARHLLEQQPVPAGGLPPEEGHRVRGAGEGLRGLSRHLRQRGEGAECRRHRRRAAQGGRAQRGYRCVRTRDAHGAPSAGRHGARQRHRPDEGHPPGLGGQRHRDVQHEPPGHQGRRQAGRGARASARRPAPSRPRARAQGAGRALELPEPGVGRHRRAAHARHELRTRAASLEDLLARETFFKELPSIEQHTKAIETEYARREDEALDARVVAYTKAFEKLVKTPGWTEIDEAQQHPRHSNTGSRSRSSAVRRESPRRCPSRSSVPTAMPAVGA